MFGSKRGNDKSKQTITTSSSSSNGTQSACVIVSGTVIEGDFYSKSDTRLDGIINGKVKCDARLIMGVEAAIEGSVETNDAKISGSFTGDLIVKGLLSLSSTAKVNATVKALKLEVEEGAVLNGDMTVSDK